MGTNTTKNIIINQINEIYHACIKTTEICAIQAMNNDEKKSLFTVIEELYREFCKYFSFELKKQIMPKQLLLIAKKKKEYSRIADMWLEYIDDYNKYKFEEDEDKKTLLISTMVKKYFSKLSYVKDFLDLPSIAKMTDKYRESYNNARLNFNKCEYSKNLEISKKAYSLIINYLKTVPVMNAWLYKEVLHNDKITNYYLIADCSLEVWSIVKNGFLRLDIPYTMELINIYEKKDHNFIVDTMYNGAVRIYNMDGNSLPGMDFDYIRWQDYYKNVFLNKYSEIENLAVEIKDNENIETFIVMNQLDEFYTATWTLIKYYLGSEGLFVNDATDTLRNAFRAGFLEDGEEWINLDYMIYKYKEHGASIFPIINFVLKDNFSLFERLKNKFESLLEEND